MNPWWRQVVCFVVVLACAIGVLVAAGLEEERAGNGANAAGR